MSHDLLSEIEVYLAETGLSPGRFGQLAANNSRLVERLRSGRRIWPDTECQVREWMAANRSRRPYQRAGAGSSEVSP